MKENYQIGFKYAGFRFLKFAFEEQESVLENEVFDFQISINIESSEVSDDQESQIIVKVIVLVGRKSENRMVADISTASRFDLKGVAGDLDEHGKIKYPETLLVTLVSLAISTTRGAILGKGGGSFLEKIPMPIVDPKTFVPFLNDKPANETP